MVPEEKHTAVGYRAPDIFTAAFFTSNFAAMCAITCSEKLRETAGRRTTITSFPDETTTLMDWRHPSP